MWCYIMAIMKDSNKETDKPIYSSIRIPSKEYWHRVKIEAAKRERDIGELVVEGLKKIGIE